MCARAEAGPVGPKRGLAAVPTQVRGAWQGFEATRRAKLAARAGRHAAAGDLSGNKQQAERPPTTRAPSSPARRTAHATPGMPVPPQATPEIRRTADHAHTKQPGPPDSTRDARNTRGAATPHSSPAAQHAA